MQFTPGALVLLSLSSSKLLDLLWSLGKWRTFTMKQCIHSGVDHINTVYHSTFSNHWERQNLFLWWAWRKYRWGEGAKFSSIVHWDHLTLTHRTDIAALQLHFTDLFFPLPSHTISCNCGDGSDRKDAQCMMLTYSSFSRKRWVYTVLYRLLKGEWGIWCSSHACV